MQNRACGRSIASMMPSGAVAADLEPGGGVLDRLVMPAVHLQHLTIGQLLLHDVRQGDAARDPDLVRDGVEGRIDLVTEAPG